MIAWAGRGCRCVRVMSGRARREIVALGGDVDNSTCTELFEEALPERYFEMYIAE